MKLYNMESDEWRKGKFKRKDSWRSKQVYECAICRTKTNKWVMGGYPGMGPRLICPGDQYLEHDRLEALIIRKKEIEKKLRDYKKIAKKQTKPGMQVQPLVEHLRIERSILEAWIKEIRKAFLKVNDIRGVDLEKTKTILFYPSARVASTKTKLRDKNAGQKKN